MISKQTGYELYIIIKKENVKINNKKCVIFKLLFIICSCFIHSCIILTYSKYSTNFLIAVRT